MKHQEAAERKNQTLAFNNTNSSSCVMVCSTAEQDHGDHAIFQHPPPDGTPATWAILFFFVCLLLGVGTRQILAKVQEKTGLRIPSTVGLLAVGMVLGAIIWEETISAVPNEMFSVSTMVWEIMDPKLILFMFLPCLIFEGSMSTDFFVFSKQFVGGMVLAFPGMVLQILMVAGFAMYCFPYGWGFGESMLFGSILSATDPVAVIALMKELALLGDLRVLIEAESLLNDGSAIVAYELCHIVLVHPGSLGDYISLAVTLTICAPLMGAACFFAMRLWVNKTTDPIQETVLTVAAAYLCYYLCESGLHISGVLSVLTLGLLYNGYGSSAMSSEEAHHMCHSFWEIFVWVADTIIFVLAGVLIIQEGFLSNSFTWVGNDWGYLVALYLALFVFRILMVIVCAPVLRYTCFGMQRRVCSRERFFKYMFILSWGGLRGIVGLVLAMVVSLDHHLGAAVSDKQYCVRVLIHVAGIVVLTTLLNAASLELLIDKLGLKAPSIIETQLVQDCVSTLSRRNKAYIQEAQNLRELCRVHWESVNAIVGLEDSLLQDKTNIGNPHDVGLQRENPHVLEKPEKSPDIVNVGPTFGASQDEERISKMEQYFHLQYLLALKCSFDGQVEDFSPSCMHILFYLLT
jgi:sodium/hydrogen exchanger 10/11